MELDFLPGASPAVESSSGAPAPGFEPEDLGALGEVPYTGDVELDSKAEESAILAGFTGRAKAEQSRRGWAEDGSYYSCLVFQTADQLEAFVRAVGLAPDRLDLLDGEALAESMGIPLPESPYKPRKMPEPTSAWDSLALELEGR